MPLSSVEIKNPSVRGKFPSLSTHYYSEDSMEEKYVCRGDMRGKYYALSASLEPPVLLDERVRWYLSQKAEAKGISLNELVNDLLKRSIVLSEKIG